MEKEVSRRAQIEKNESSSVAHMNPTPLDSIYIRTKLLVFSLEYGGQVTYVETHPKLVDPP